jgi:hypothetical protein
MQLQRRFDVNSPLLFVETSKMKKIKGFEDQNRSKIGDILFMRVSMCQYRQRQKSYRKFKSFVRNGLF